MHDFFSSWTTKDYVTAGVALYGAVLSTINLIAKWKERRMDVRVTLQMVKKPVFARDQWGGQSNQVVPGRVRAYLSIMVRNHGYPNVSLPKDCCVLEPRERDPIQLPESSSLPVTLAYGESIALVASPEYASGVTRMRAIVSDQLSRKFYSRWVTFDADETAALLRDMEDHRSF